MTALQGETSGLLSVVVPTYNEAANIEQALAGLCESLAGSRFEVVVVDDDSPDGTADAARSFAAGDPRVAVVVRQGRRGLTSAVLHGVSLASGDAFAVIDGDGQHDPSALAEMAEAVLSGSVDLSVCCRPRPAGAPAARRAVTRVAAMACRVLLPRLKLVSDPLSGCFVVSRSHQLRCVAPSVASRGFKVLWLFLCCGPEPATAEVLRPLRPRSGGRSKFSAPVAAADLLTMVAIRLQRAPGAARVRAAAPRGPRPAASSAPPR